MAADNRKNNIRKQNYRVETNPTFWLGKNSVYIITLINMSKLKSKY